MSRFLLVQLECVLEAAGWYLWMQSCLAGAGTQLPEALVPAGVSLGELKLSSSPAPWGQHSSWWDGGAGGATVAAGSAQDCGEWKHRQTPSLCKTSARDQRQPFNLEERFSYPDLVPRRFIPGFDPDTL